MRNIIKSAIQNFKNFKLYSSINLFGLILGLSCSAVLFLYVCFEYSFDNFHKDKSRIFRVSEITTSLKERSISPFVRMPYGPALKSEISEIEDVVRIRNNRHNNTLKFEDKQIALKKAIFADSNLFDFFSFQVVTGNPNQLLADKNSLVLTQKIAKRIFGEENPIGKLVEYDNNTLTITGVIEDVPLNSHIQFDAVFPMETLLNSPDVHVGWDGGITAITFVKLYKSDLNNKAEAKFPRFLWEKVNKKNEELGFKTEFFLEPLLHIHLFSDVDWDSNSKDGKQVLMLLFIGFLILLIAIINYLFISSGTLTLRLKEFRVKHYFGLGEKGIAKQLFIETLILFLFATAISVLFIYEIKAYITQLFSVDFISFQLQKNIILLVVFIVLISSIVAVIQFITYKGKVINAEALSSFSTPFRSKRLVYISALQFAISIGLISAMLIVYKQLNFALHKDLGFKVENVINLSSGAVGAKQDILVAEIKKLSGVENVSASIGIPGLECTANGYRPEGWDQPQIFNALYVDDHFFDTFKLDLIAGRNFRAGKNSDTKEFIINQTLARQLNWENPVGKSLFRDGEYKIIGVVKDFHVGLIYSEIPPLIMSKELSNYFYSLSIALKPDETEQTIKELKSLWSTLMPGAPFNYAFMEDKFKDLYAEIQQTATILFLFTGISILVSILGLFGITLLLVNSKIKEIGIRKVNGAKVNEIVTMLNRDFVKWIIIAFVVAVPVTWYIMYRWLQSFAYKIELRWWIFTLAGVIALGVAFLTISWHSWKAATRNPIDALRHE